MKLNGKQKEKFKSTNKNAIKSIKKVIKTVQFTSKNFMIDYK